MFLSVLAAVVLRSRPRRLEHEGGVLAWDTVDSPALASREDDCRGSVRSWDFLWLEVSTKFRESFNNIWSHR